MQASQTNYHANFVLAFEFTAQGTARNLALVIRLDKFPEVTKKGGSPSHHGFQFNALVTWGENEGSLHFGGPQIIDSPKKMDGLGPLAPVG